MYQYMRFHIHVYVYILILALSLYSRASFVCLSASQFSPTACDRFCNDLQPCCYSSSRKEHVVNV